MSDGKMPTSLDDIPLAEKLKILKKNAKKKEADGNLASATDEQQSLSHRLALLKRKLEETEIDNFSTKDAKTESKSMAREENRVKKDADDVMAKQRPKTKSTKKPSVQVEEVKKSVKKSATKKEASLSDDPNNGEEKDETEQQEYKWWEEGASDNSVKWETLEHCGPLFPPLYQPHGVPMKYNGQFVHLEPEAEEVAGFFAALLGTDHAENVVFQQNFFTDFKQVLNECDSKWKDTIQEFSKCDFTPMHNHFEALKEKKRSLSKEEKERIKQEKAEQEKTFGLALLDGRQEKIGNFRIEPPGLFRGRGKHPKTGKLKRRVQPEQVTINVGESCKIPAAPEGHNWNKVIHDNTVTWLATWIENINGAQKYVFLAPSSSLKGQSDLKKFETARRLKKFVDKIRTVNAAELHDKEMFVRQRATALWLIDHLALRAGNEKGEDEADTVGCCSLRLEHIKLVEPSTVVFDFLGKDSIRYYNQVRVEPIIFKNLSIFMRSPKKPSDPIFDRLNTSTLNKYLNGLMEGLTAKVFRTFNASHTFQVELEKTPLGDVSVAEKILAYSRANRQVAILCNHQKAIPKTHEQSMGRLKEKILTLKYQRHLIRQQIKESMDRKEIKSKCPAALEPESDMDTATIKRKEMEAEQALLEKYKKAHPDDSNAATPPPLAASPQKRTSSSADSLVNKFESLTTRIHAAEHSMIERDENKATALGTSKTNYIDPRITAAWCTKHDVPVEKIFNKALREKFKWALSVDKKWKF